MAGKASSREGQHGRTLPAVPVLQNRTEQPAIQKKENKTGLPDDLKAGIENLSGYSMDDVRTHYNSDKPAQLQALAYAQGTDIHLASGQEKHLPHEAWHVVQQKQGRVQSTTQLFAMDVNVNKDLEMEADRMGSAVSGPEGKFSQYMEHAGQNGGLNSANGFPASLRDSNTTLPGVIQGMFYEKLKDSDEYVWHWGPVIGSVWKKNLDENGAHVIHNGYGAWERKHNRASGQPLSFYSFIESNSGNILKAASTIAVGYFFLSFLSSIPQAAAQQLMLAAPEIAGNVTGSTAVAAQNSSALADIAIIMNMVTVNVGMLGLLQQHYALQQQQRPQFALQIYEPMQVMTRGRLIAGTTPQTEKSGTGLVIEGSGLKKEELVDHIAKETGLISEQVEEVIGHFHLDKEKISYHSGSLNELTNYVKKVYGKEYSGKAGMPEVRGKDSLVRQTVKKRLKSEIWGKVKFSDILDPYKDKMAEVLNAITQIEIHLKRRGYLDEKYIIEHPKAWIDQYLEGVPFESTPVVNNEGKILWRKDQKTMPKELTGRKSETVVTDREIPGIFGMLQSQVPGKDPKDGCFARADFTSYYMQVLRDFKGVGKIRVDVKSGNSDLKPTSTHFMEGVEGVVWKMHTAATITTKDGQTYVMDIALQKPLTPDEWIKALTAMSGDQLIISNTKKWNYHLGDQKENGVSLIDVLSQLRGLHISEMFGHKNNKGLLPWSTWENAKDFAPIDEVKKIKNYVLRATDEPNKMKGIFKGEEISDASALEDPSSYCKLDFLDNHVVLYVPREVTKIRMTGISGIGRISKEDIEERCKELDSDLPESETSQLLPSVTELSEDPVVRGKQILDLNKEYLAREVDVIRIHTHAIAGQHGRGHQAAAISVIEQLAREYCGDARIEMIIEAEPEAMYVFENLVTGFDPAKDMQELTYKSCNFTVIRQGPGHRGTPSLPFERRVGIYPADDMEIWDDDVTNIEYSKKLMDSMGTQSLISLNPHAWGVNKRFIDKGSKSYPITESESSIYKGGTYRDLGTEGMSPIDELLKNNIMKLVQMVNDGEIDLCGTYGLHFTDSSGGSSMKSGESIVNGLAETAVIYQMRRGNTRPLVIVNLSKKNLDHTRFIRSKLGALENTKTTLSYYEITKPMELSVSGSGDVIFIDVVSGIPKDWFSFVMDHSTLPIIYEGANTANLAHQMGKKFLSIRPMGSTPYIEIPGFEEGRERLEEAGVALAGLEGPMNPGSLVAAVLLEMEQPESDVAKYVNEVLKLASDPEADQVLMAIAKLREIAK